MLNPSQIQAASTTVRELRVALSNFILYSAGNNMALLSIQRLLAGLDRLFEEFSSITLGESEGRLVVEGTPLDEHVTGSTNMIKDLFLTHKIHSLTFQKGVDTEELKSLFSLLKPKGLKIGLSFSQALVQLSLQHIRANEKVFVAVGEGEVLVPSASAPTGEQNLQEALEALQYFLQIFARVKPESNKQEVAKKLMDHMGAWLGPEAAGFSDEMKDSPSASPRKQEAWMEVFGGVMALKKGLAAVSKPSQVQEAQQTLEDLLRKLVLLGEKEGIQAGPEADKPDHFVSPEGGEKQGPFSDPGQVPLSENDPVLSAVSEGRLDVFWNESSEEMADQRVSRLQDPDQLENFEPLWNGLWEKIFSGDERTQALCLRHLNRLQWPLMPRALQLEGLRNLRRFLTEVRRAAVYPIGLTLAQDWIPLELAHPDWVEILEMVRLLKQSAEKKPPAFEKQNEAAKVALETVFCEPVLDSLLNRYQAGSPESEGISKLFVILGGRATPFLFQKIEQDPVESPSWKKAVELLAALQSEGNHVYEFWLEWPEKRDRLEKFLEIFKVKPLTGELADYFERHWTSFGPSAQAKILEIVEHWKRTDFRSLLLQILSKPENPIAIPALRTLSVVGLEGDTEAIVGAVEKYPPHGKDREAFWIAACRALGNLADPAGESALMEWADKYKLLEAKKNRSLEVRRAALEALSRFHNPKVRGFLAGLQKEGEKELQAVIQQSLSNAGEKPRK